MAQADRPNANGPEGMLTLVCLTCGNELFFTNEPPKNDEKCSRCGSMVFRSFFTPTVRDDATESMLEDTARSISTESAPSDSTAGDVRDLNNP
jgi:DNA-directed RNA polymerase subunit RPC12/RpoP